MVPESPMKEPLTCYDHENPYRSPPARKQTDHLHSIPLPVLTRTTTQMSTQSAASFSSTTDLLPRHASQRKKRVSLKERVVSWYWRSEKPPDAGVKDQSAPQHPKRRLKAWHGWRYVLFGSWLNVFLLLIPASWILKLATTGTDTLIFTACMLAMIPLVKFHDMAIGVLSRRIGGSKTGLVNASFSNLIELVVAITALRQCELHVVQSSLIGSILSKQLLILGMCFLAGGLRFYHQDYDSTATQIHSSLLNIGVGAVCLPAAFHFALSYRAQDLQMAGTTLEQQKEDILMMSHSVSCLLLMIYFAYLVFQLGSHTHLYQDSTKPSEKIPVVPLSLSVRSFTERVRASSGNRRVCRSNSQSSWQSSLRSRVTGTLTAVDGRQARSEKEKASPVEEVPETSFDCFEGTGAQYANCPGGSRHRTAYLLSAHGTTSQVTLPVDDFESKHKEDPTVRLVQGTGRHGRSASVTDGSSESVRRYSSSSEDSRRSSFESPQSARLSINEVVSAYSEERADVHHSVVNAGDKERPGGRQNQGPSVPSSMSTEDVEEREPELSWTMTFALLTTVTVLVTINSEWLVDSMDSLSPTLSKEWIGLILLPVVSSIAECVTAVSVSVKDRLTLSISVAVGSSIQTTLFVIPAMVLLGWALGKPLPLLFDPFETVVLYISVHIMGYVVADGKSNWLEGVILISLYLVIAVSFWFYPGSSFSSNLAVCVDST